MVAIKKVMESNESHCKFLGNGNRKKGHGSYGKSYKVLLDHQV